MSKFLSSYFVSLLLMTCLSSFGQVKLTVSMDSANLLMGKVTPYHIELQLPDNAAGHLVIPPDSLNEKVEIAKVGKADTIREGNGRMIIQQTLLLQSFDSGIYPLKPVMYVSGSDTIVSDQMAVKVDPVPVDTLATIHDYADVLDVNRRLVDYLPDFLVKYGLWLLAMIVALGVVAGVIWYNRRRKKGIPLLKAKEVPPYEQAVSELEALHQENLCETGREKEFYTRLTDILRVYLERRFGINAMEMTSRQIMQHLDRGEETRMSRKHMEQVLRIADFVKFAKVRPLPNDNVQSFKSALQFVEDTKPTDIAESDKKTGDVIKPDDNAAR